MTNTARETDYTAFKAAAEALGAELGGKCSVFRDTDGMWSAVIEEAPGRNAPETIEEDGYTARLWFSLTLTKTFGFDSVGVMLDVIGENYTCDTRMSDIETQGADALERLYERARVQPGV